MDVAMEVIQKRRAKMRFTTQEAPRRDTASKQKNYGDDGSENYTAQVHWG
jgi:hypothetical protein